MTEESLALFQSGLGLAHIAVGRPRITAQLVQVLYTRGGDTHFDVVDGVALGFAFGFRTFVDADGGGLGIVGAGGVVQRHDGFVGLGLVDLHRPSAGRQPSRSLSKPMRTTLYGARKPSEMPWRSE